MRNFQEVKKYIYAGEIIGLLRYFFLTMRVRSAFEFFRMRPENPILILIVNMFVTCVLT